MKYLILLYNFIKKIILTSILWGALLFFNCLVNGQENIIIPDSITRVDSSLLVNNDSIITRIESSNLNFTETNTEIKTLGKEEYMRIKKEHSPRTAGLYSAIIPGLGQAYNRKYWKMPIIYIGGGILIKYFIEENTEYKKYKELYELEYYKPPGEQNAEDLDKYGLYRDGYRKNRDRLMFFTGLVYAVNIIDAMVDAYFYNFDVGDNLTLKIKPAVDYPVLAMGNCSYGVKLSFKF